MSEHSVAREKQLADYLSIFRFVSFADFLSEYMRCRKEVEPQFSFRNLARKMDLKSTSSLAMVTSGKRKPSQELMAKLAAALNMTPDEKVYMDLLISLESASSPQQKKYFLDQMATYRRFEESNLIDMDQFELISNWYHFAIVEMAKSRDFVADPPWILQRLVSNHAGEREITSEEIADSLELLERVGLLERREDGRLHKSPRNFRTTRNIPSGAIKQYHSQVLHLASEAVYNQSVEERYLSATTMTFDQSQMDEIQSLIVDFRNKVSSLARNRKEDGSVYQLAIQFFKLSQQ